MKAKEKKVGQTKSIGFLYKMILPIIGSYHFMIGLVGILSNTWPSFFGYYYGGDNWDNYIFGGVFMYSGYLTLLKKKRGLEALIVLNLLQCFSFQTDSFAYKFYTGFTFVLNMRNLETNYFFYNRYWDTPLPAQGFFNCFGDGSHFSLNIIALIFLFFLFREYSKILNKPIQPWEIDFQK